MSSQDAEESAESKVTVYETPDRNYIFEAKGKCLYISARDLDIPDSKAKIADKLGVQVKDVLKGELTCNKVENILSLSPEPIILHHLNLIETPELVEKHVVFEAVVGSTSIAYNAPTRVQVTREERGIDELDERAVDDHDPLNIQLVAIDEDRKQRRLQRLFNVSSSTLVRELAWRTVYRIRLRPQVFTLEKLDDKVVDEKGYEYKAFDVYVASDRMLTFQPSTLIRLEGCPTPNPRTQSTTFLAWKGEFPEDVQNFDLTRLALLQLKFEGLTVKERMTWILDNFEKYSQIVGRRNLAEAAFLTYFTPTHIKLNRKVEHGWGNIGLIGDTTTAKTETIRKLLSLLKAGLLITAETASTVGLTGTATQIEREGWFVDWGFLVLNDRKLLAIDGAHKLSLSNWASLAEAERSGVVTIVKAAKNSAYARTRQVKIANPVDKEAEKYSTKPLSSFLYPCQSLSTIFDKTEIARLDIAVFSNQYDVKAEDINKEFKDDFDPDILLLPEALKWCWSDSAQVAFTDEAVTYLLQQATELDKTFFCESVPLVSKDMKWKLARLSASLANLTLSTEDFKTVTVTKAHVEAVVEFLTDEYSEAGLNTLAQSDRFETLDQDEAKAIFNHLIEATELTEEKLKKILNHVVLKGRTTKDALTATFSLADKNELRPLIGVLSSEGLIKAGKGFYPTPKLIQLYKVLIGLEKWF